MPTLIPNRSDTAARDAAGTASGRGDGTPTAAWRGFAPCPWTEATDVRDFIQRNYALYESDATFLARVPERTKKAWGASASSSRRSAAAACWTPRRCRAASPRTSPATSTATAS